MAFLLVGTTTLLITILLTELRQQELTNSPFDNSVTKSIGRVIHHSLIFTPPFCHKLTKGIMFPETLNKTHQNICGTGKMQTQIMITDRKMHEDTARS
jgi:hypothetical protein